MRRRIRSLLLLPLALALASAARATTYEVGPAKPLATIGEVPWASLQPGDTVLIHWRATPYREKWVICRQGTVSAPIVVRGIPGPGGALPIIDGDAATTAPGLNFWNDPRGVIKIGGANVPADTTPRYIEIDGLEIRNARPPYAFTDDGGSALTYAANASTVYIEKGEQITIKNCILHDAGNGLFVASSPALASRDIRIEGNHIYGNGNPGSIFEHNTYTAAVGITYQFNRFGPLCAGCGGNNLKDRSAGLVVRNNWIEGGNRQLDLVDAEDSPLIRDDPSYAETHVYRNFLIEPAGAGNRQIAHYGGDSGTLTDYRKGTLFFYNNTIVSHRTDRTTLLRLSTNDETCDARNNLVHLSAAAGNTLALLDASGTLEISHNWLEPGWVNSFGAFEGVVIDDGTSVQGTAPGFLNEAAEVYDLALGSPCIDAGTALDPQVLPDHAVTREYGKHRAQAPRPVDVPLDIGADEVCGAGAPGAIQALRWMPGPRRLVWPAGAPGALYDVVLGDLAALRAGGGDFTSSVSTCVADDTPLTEAPDDVATDPGGAVWYLVRAIHCEVVLGSFDSGETTQAGSRDAEIAASAVACP